MLARSRPEPALYSPHGHLLDLLTQIARPDVMLLSETKQVTGEIEHASASAPADVVLDIPTVGSCHDMCEGPTILRQARQRSRLGLVLLDAGYDAESTHALIREELGGQSLTPPKQCRGMHKWPTGACRREMRRKFPKDLYGQRWQVESAISPHKRRLGSSLRATSWAGQQREVYMRVLVHSLLILLPFPRHFSTEQGRLRSGEL